MASPPLISVIVPSYNHAGFLPYSIASIAQQRSAEVDVEAIVVNDGSTDNTAEVVNGLETKVHYIHQKNMGLPAARNTGLRAACGDFIAFLDADDLFTEGVLASHLQVFEAQPELDISICRCMNLEEDGNNRLLTLWSLVNSHWDVHACNANLAPVHSYLIRTSLARRVGFFDQTLKSCEDQDYWLRCYGLGAKVGINAEGLVLYRKHCGGMTENRARMYHHDSLMHEKVGRMLADLPDFPLQAKCAGWLAHAAGCLVSAGYLCRLDPERSLAMQDFFTRAVLSAAPLFSSKAQSGISVDVRHLQNYYGGRCLRLANWSGLQLTPAAAKAVLVLNRMFPRLAGLSAEALDARLRSGYAKLCVLGLPSQVRMDSAP